MAQHAFWREDDEGFAPVTQGLTAQAMEVLSGVRRLSDLAVVLGRELDEALNAGARVFRPLPFVAVGEKHDEARKQVPLGFSGADELIDDGLRDVHEIAELRFP